MQWQTFRIRPLYPNKRGFSQEFYAPTLETAFALARGRWPSAIGWECL